jgi:hypothetical protein
VKSDGQDIPTLFSELTLSTASYLSKGKRSAGVYGEFVLPEGHTVVFLKLGVQ